ncbi:hypothetical protein NORO109296_08055 [Nocardiopsis rhodophaea]
MLIFDPRNNPRHPCPELWKEFGPRGWTFFRTDYPYGPPRFHAVFCRSLPAKCALRLQFREHVAAPLDELRPLVAEQADAIEKHAKTCHTCARVLENARRRTAGL